MLDIDYLENNKEFTDRLFYSVKMGVRIGSLLVGFAYVLFALVDPFFGVSDLTLIYTSRMILVLFSILVFGFTFLNIMQNYSLIRYLSYLVIIISGGGVAYLTMLVGGPESSYWSMIVLTFFGGTLLMHFTFLQSLLINLSVFILYNILLLAHSFPFLQVSSIVSTTGLLLGVIVSAVASAYLRHLKVIEFRAMKILNDTNKDLQKILGELADEKEKSEKLLLNILPESIANRLRIQDRVIADRYEEVSVLFADLVNFTQYAESKSPEEIVKILNGLFSLFDKLTDHYGLEKIKTIGDAYLVVGGLPDPIQDHLDRIVKMALDMQKVMDEFNKEFNENFQLRIGIHSGPAVAGVIGKKKFIYDLWGDSVNIASRMESTGLPGKIQINQEIQEKLSNRYQISERGELEIKGKGLMRTYFIDGLMAA
ncbi:MAG: hypothetical protein JJT78_13265 [Leptospira sp.]|nr:hypothetical protein [Leptospira sp.]